MCFCSKQVFLLASVVEEVYVGVFWGRGGVAETEISVTSASFVIAKRQSRFFFFNVNPNWDGISLSQQGE